MPELSMVEPLRLDGLLEGGWEKLAFTPFREGLEIFPILDGAPALAVLRYAPGAVVPHHRHTGLESILVLDGAQEDEQGHYPKGSLVLNQPGSSHSVWSQAGCVVLIQWTAPIIFTDTSPL
jgi:anti-sigma factor ChrR (cupin superfamily)